MSLSYGTDGMTRFIYDVTKLISMPLLPAGAADAPAGRHVHMQYFELIYYRRRTNVSFCLHCLYCMTDYS